MLNDLLRQMLCRLGGSDHFVEARHFRVRRLLPDLLALLVVVEAAGSTTVFVDALEEALGRG